jgi:hypothetical protein
MKNVTSNLKDAGAALVQGIASLLAGQSSLRDINKPSSSVVFIGPHYAFGELSLEKRRLQSRLVEDYRHFFILVRALLRTQADEVRRTIDQNDQTVREVIEQTHCVWHATAEDASAAVKQAIEVTLDAVECLYDPSEGSVALVPDTNALIYAPVFQAWEFNGIPQFDIVLVPTVLSELDSLKNEHRNPEVRKKSHSIIRQIKEYRRRGPLSEGVVIVANRIRVRAVAIEPRLEESLPWLDPTSADDRMIASFVEVMRVYPRSIVVLVTADINLQNKAEFARLPFTEPPTCGEVAMKDSEHGV